MPSSVAGPSSPRTVGAPTGPGSSDASPTVIHAVHLPERLSIEATRALAEAFRSYFLVPRSAQFSPPTFRSWSDPAAGRFEYYWVVPVVFRGPGGPTVLVGCHLVLSPTETEIGFLLAEPPNDAERAVLAGMADAIRRFVTAFLEAEKRSSLFLVVAPYPPPAGGGAAGDGGSESARRIFSGNSTNVFLLIMLVTIPAILLIGLYALVLTIALQGVAVFYGDRIVLRGGPVLPTAERPRGVVVGVTLPKDAKGRLPRVTRTQIARLRPRLQAALASAPEGDAAHVAWTALREAGIDCPEGAVEVTGRDVHGLVARVAARYGLPTPKVVLTEQGSSNAAATGVSPARASIMITAGSLEELDDPELEAVVGHELGHVKGRDSLVLFSVTAVLYLGALFVWPSVLLELGLFYLVLVFVATYAVGKVLETRADTYSASVLGRARELATALTSIAFGEYFAEERSPSFRAFRWFSLDSHPPVYFRVQRLGRLAGETAPVADPFLRSLRDCLAGFGRSLIGRE